MPVRVRIPTPLRSLTRERAEVSAEGRTVAEVIADLDRAYPGLGARLLAKDGALRRYVNVFVNDEDARHLGGAAAPVSDGDRLTLVPAIAGGRPWP